MEPALSVGDIVRHRVLGKEKVIIGIGKDRYLCATPEDIQADGRLRSQARVTLHRGKNLHKIDHHGKVMAVSLDHLYERELKQARRLQRRDAFKKRAMPYLLLTVTVVPICFVLLSGLEMGRSHIESTFLNMLARQALESMEEEAKTSDKKDEKEKEKSQTREEASQGDANKEAIRHFKERYLKTDIKGEEARRLKERYLKTDISEEEIKRLAERYLQGGMANQEKEMLKQKYLKPGVGEQEKEMLKRKYLRQ